MISAPFEFLICVFYQKSKGYGNLFKNHIFIMSFPLLKRQGSVFGNKKRA